MAKIYPDKPNPNTTSRAEVFLFSAFQEGLSNDYVVFHSVAWQVRDTHGGIQDGETDFLIINSNMDLLVIEVKGGSIRYDGIKDKWYSNNSQIKNPFSQGKCAKYSLLKKLKEIPRWEGRWLNIGSAVAFPNITIYDDLFLYAPRELILDFSDTQELAEWIERAFGYLKQDREYEYVRYDHEDIEAIVQLLSPSWEFHSELAREIETQENIITRLTKDQFLILDYLSRHRRVAITGCAGSGKTLVAVEQAFKLSKNGFSTLLLCHSPQLADFLSRQIKCDLVKVIDFVSWINQIIEKSEPLPNNQWLQFLEPPAEDLGNAFDRITRSDKKYDAIIVDEGQDFREIWWLVVEAALGDREKSILYIFHDDNQALYLYGSQSQYPIQQAPYTLSRNCRNAGRIFEIIQKLYPQAPEPSLNLAGRGIVKDFPCTRDEILPTVFNAVREARKLINHKYRLVLLTAEIGSPQQSILNDQEIHLQTQGEVISQWQKAVKQYTHIPIGTLSSNPYPTIDDIEEVTEQAKPNSRNRRGGTYGNYEFGDEDLILDRVRRLRWGTDPNGTMFLRNLPSRRDNYRQHLIWRFFADKNWANGIPKIQTTMKLITEGTISSDTNENHIPLHSVASFKGLEADGVILFYWGHYPTGDELLALNTLYVGLSRAKHLLYFVSPIALSEVLDKKDIYFPDPNLFCLD